ncbi:uncharacterized protein LOC121644111 [Melanotaenia boesemani]|uniref:uncharacterized protein LOC121644111 n=1 Tax=Melanotaenia boesemani TaxID=1250792 RepID=UPI001C03C1C5|nr:uncharacterized protein LOC121644111 [Melanotaenia boesemani]
MSFCLLAAKGAEGRGSRRLAMKLLPALPVLWLTLLILRVSQSEAEISYTDACQEMMPEDLVHVQNSIGMEDYKEIDKLEGTSFCFLDLTYILNCSWSFYTSDENAQLSVQISVCDENKVITSQSQASVKRDGSWTFPDQQIQSVILQFNMSGPDKWETYTYAYDHKILRHVPPPANISASIIDGNLHVKWDLACKDSSNNSECFEYELDMGQQNPRHLTGVLSHTEPNVDSSLTYRVKMRTRFQYDSCRGPRHWSDWSHTVTVEQSLYSFDPLVIVCISLGIPMMLLAVLLLVRHQRVNKVLFPPIPHPPPKYKNFLERNDQMNFFYPAPPAKMEEEITEVEDTEPNPEKIY